MSLAEYRASPNEKKRTADLVRLFPAVGNVALDIGARDGHFSRLLAERFGRVIALDLEKPEFDCPGVECVKGDAANLELEDESIDFVFCAEVLEHIPPPILGRVCREIERVSRDQVLIGVPYRQDIRVGRTTCQACGCKNPPWGHVNSFDESRIAELFPSFRVDAISFVGKNKSRTNALSTKLMDLAGNPYGTYAQDEPCIQCGAQLVPPPGRSLGQKALTRLAFWSRAVSEAMDKPRGNWIHVLLTREGEA